MPDIVDSATRSRMMAGIRSTNTRPEIAIRSALHANGFRYRLHSRKVPGKPDMVFPRYRAAVFVNGCFRPTSGRPARYVAGFSVDSPSRGSGQALDDGFSLIGLWGVFVKWVSFRV